MKHEIKTVHLIAICGTGMGSFAGLLKEAGYTVTGSDENVYPPMSDQLEKWGIPIMHEFSPKNLDHNPDLIIVGNVCRRENPECVAATERQMRLMSFPQSLSEFFLNNKYSIVIAGTHGKTTTSSLLAHLLHESDLDPSFMIGGVLANFGGNFRLGSGKYFVVEGDEYDTAYFDKGAKFLHYQPQTSILTNIEFDHADIFRDLSHVIETFDKFISIIPKGGYLAVCGDEKLALERSQNAKCQVETYGLNNKNIWTAHNIRFNNQGTEFDLINNGQNFGHLISPMSGSHNLKNLLGVCAVAYRHSLTINQIQVSLNTFQGIAKRQEVKGMVNDIVVIDDFAHHPTAVRETIKAIRNKYPDSKIWALFEAKSNTSRMKIFQEEYVDSFKDANEVVMAKPYKKKDNLKPEEQIDVQQICKDLEALKIKAHHIKEYDEIAKFVAHNAKQGDVIIGMSGSSFGGVHKKILDLLSSSYSD